MLSNQIQPNILFINCLLHESFRDKVFFSFAGEIYQRKVISLIKPKANYSINIGNCTSKIFSEENTIYHVYRKSKIFFFFQILHFLISVSKGVKNIDIIMFYNINARNILCFYYLKYLKRLPCFVIVTDYNLPETSLKDHFIHSALKKSEGILALSEHLKLIKNIQYSNLLLLPQWDIVNDLNYYPIQPKSILLSGMLNESTGLSLALEMMEYLPDYCLYISGILTDASEKEFNDSLKCINNIKYLGKLTHDEYSSLLKRMEFCLSLRNPTDPSNKFNFPSKIGEFLCYNKKVISTINYTNFKSLIQYSPYNAINLADTIKNSENISYFTEDIIDMFGGEVFLNKIQLLIKGK